MPLSPESDAAWAGREPRPWQRLRVRLAGLFAVVTLLAVGAVGLFTYERQQHEVQDTVGTQLLNMARVTALLVDPVLHSEVQQTRNPVSNAYRELQKRLVTIQNEVLLTTPIYTIADFDPAARRARVVVVSDGAGRPGDVYPLATELIDPLRWTFEDGVARYTGLYTNGRGTWITAFAPIMDTKGRAIAVVTLDYPVEIYLDRLHELRATLVYASVIGALGTLILGLLFARRLTRPIRALTAGVARVAAGDLSQAQMKGLAEPLELFELRGLGGRYAQCEVATESDAAQNVSVALPITCWVIEGKVVGQDGIAGRVVRLGRRELAACLDAPLAPLTNVKLRLGYPDAGRASGDIYGKVVREEPGETRPLTRIHFTSVTSADAEAVEALVAAPVRAYCRRG